MSVHSALIQACVLRQKYNYPALVVFFSPDNIFSYGSILNIGKTSSFQAAGLQKGWQILPVSHCKGVYVHKKIHTDTYMNWYCYEKNIQNSTIT